MAELTGEPLHILLVEDNEAHAEARDPWYA